MKVFLVEDDILLGESLKDYLSDNNFSVQWVFDDREVMQFFMVESFDVVVLDLMLKYSKGEYLLKEIKKKYTDLPVIITTAKDTIKSKQECFMLGADDYVIKPFDPKELILRINAVCGRYSKLDDIEDLNGVKIDIKNQKVEQDGIEIKLTGKEWDILSFLLKKRGSIVTFDDILNYVWHDSYVGEESVRTYIKRLRAKLPDNSIITHKGRGYELK